MWGHAPEIPTPGLGEDPSVYGLLWSNREQGGPRVSAQADTTVVEDPVISGASEAYLVFVMTSVETLFTPKHQVTYSPYDCLEAKGLVTFICIPHER